MIIESIDMLNRDKKAYLAYLEKNLQREKRLLKTVDPANPETELLKIAGDCKEEAIQSELRIEAIDFEIDKLSEN